MCDTGFTKRAQNNTFLPIKSYALSEKKIKSEFLVNIHIVNTSSTLTTCINIRHMLC